MGTQITGGGGERTRGKRKTDNKLVDSRPLRISTTFAFTFRSFGNTYKFIVQPSTEREPPTCLSSCVLTFKYAIKSEGEYSSILLPLNILVCLEDANTTVAFFKLDRITTFLKGSNTIASVTIIRGGFDDIFLSCEFDVISHVLDVYWTFNPETNDCTQVGDSIARYT